MTTIVCLRELRNLIVKLVDNGVSDWENPAYRCISIHYVILSMSFQFVLVFTLAICLCKSRCFVNDSFRNL